jgi:hypothetical protein
MCILCIPLLPREILAEEDPNPEIEFICRISKYIEIPLGAKLLHYWLFTTYSL